jgi:hypothetical protein
MQIYIHNYNKRLIIFSVLAFFVLTSCRITLLPDYDDAIANQIEEDAKKVDKFYLVMLETTKSGDRPYNEYVDSYVEIEVDLTALLTKNKIRPLNENSTRICEITLELWIKYKNEHKEDNDLTDGLIELNRKTFSDLFYAMQVAEAQKEILNNPPN